MIRTGGPLTTRWAEINVAALIHNAAVLVSHAAPAAVMAMVKADGYGHGAITAARAFLDGGVKWLGVSSAEEALELRAAGIDAPILNVGWTHPSFHSALVLNDVDITVWKAADIGAVAAVAEAADRAARVQLKIDTGLARLGCSPAEALPLLELVTRGPVHLTGVFTHFADADAPDLDFSAEQHRRFAPIIAAARRHSPEIAIHCLNSAGLARLPELRYDIVRPGIALYGYIPGVGDHGLDLRPAMTVVARVTNVKTVGPGETVGYGRTWTASKPTRLATVAAGYADGVHRAQANVGVVLIGGVRCPIVGAVSMDQITVIVDDVDTVAIGDEAVVFGTRDGITLGADETAAAAGTIAYELLCGVSKRVPRLVVRTLNS